MTSGVPPIAIVGMSCRVPGAQTLAEFWDLLNAGERRFAPVPTDRWRGLEPELAATVVPRASMLDGLDLFDARFFGIAPRMAAWMDPQHRLLLELAWHAVENAGIDPDTLAGEPVAVFAGGFMTDFRERMNDLGRSDSAAFPGTLMSFLANRVSYQLGLTGPSMVIDSACSSSLTALGLAVRGLRDGEYPMALVGAANLFGAGHYANHAYRGGALSRTGESVPFAADRNGYVRGEGGACLLLEPLPNALDGGRPVHAVIRAVGTAHNGRAGGLTGTDPDTQLRLTRSTVRAAQCSIRDLGYLEAHGTGTPAGDAAELEALARALRDPTGRPVSAAGPDGRLWVGSVKANIGHLEAAAGLVGLIKAALVLRHGRIPRVAGLETADPELPIGQSPVTVAVRDVPWPAGRFPRRAAINSFGLGGSMSQVVLEEPSGPPDRTPESGRRYLVPLSAETRTSLALLAERLLRELDDVPPPDLAGVAWTMQTARRARRERRAVVVSDLDELRTALRELVDGAEGVDDVDADDHVRAWLKGETVDWRSFWDGAEPDGVPLPGSVFERRRHWYDET